MPWSFPRLFDPRGRVWTNDLPFLCSQGISFHVNTMYRHCTCNCFMWVGSLASQPHSVPQRWSLSVSACEGRVWRLRTTLREQLERNYWISRVKHAIYCIRHTHPTTPSCHGFMNDISYVNHWDGTDQSLTRITASPLLVVVKRLFTKFTTTFCSRPLRSYSSFRLASTIAAKTTSWTFLPCQSWGINAIMISLMWQNQL